MLWVFLCRKDLNEPPTPVGGILPFWTPPLDFGLSTFDFERWTKLPSTAFPPTSTLPSPVCVALRVTPPLESTSSVTHPCRQAWRRPTRVGSAPEGHADQA